LGVIKSLKLAKKIINGLRRTFENIKKCHSLAAKSFRQRLLKTYKITLNITSFSWLYSQFLYALLHFFLEKTLNKFIAAKFSKKKFKEIIHMNLASYFFLALELKNLKN
jgi:hypothetical protein